MFWLSSQESGHQDRSPLALKAHTLGPHCMCEQSIPDTIPVEFSLHLQRNERPLGVEMVHGISRALRAFAHETLMEGLQHPG